MPKSNKKRHTNTDMVKARELHDAIKAGNIDAINVLLRSDGINLLKARPKGCTENWSNALWHNKYDIATCIAPYQCEFKGKFLHTAAIFNAENSLRALLTHGYNSDSIDINARDGNGKTPLMVAAKHGYDAAAVLIEFGAALDIVDADGKSALIHSADESDAGRVCPDMAELLCEAGASVDIRDNSGHTALYYTLSYCDVDVAIVLIQAGASVDEYDYAGPPVNNACFAAIRMAESKWGCRDVHLAWIQSLEPTALPRLRYEARKRAIAAKE